jgi:D-3-phosphoglycerate dehydrogenase / 2-oxoglutarate reductase
MKKWDSKLKIKRTSTSPYFSAAFNEQEKKSLAPFGAFLASDDSTLADILITNTHTDFSSWNKLELENLKMIIHPNSGYDNFPEDFVKTFKAPIIIGNPIRSSAVAEYILSALFSHYSSIPAHSQWSKERKWPRKLLSELKVTLIGFGHIGKILQASLQEKVLELHIYDPFEGHDEFNTQDSDVVILAAGLNKKSLHLINKNILNTLSPEALIINAARGELIKTQDLVDFLSSNPKAFAVLDVFEKEPNDFSDFKNLKNIILTSHIAGVYKNIGEKTIEFTERIIRDFTTLSAEDFKATHHKIILQHKMKSDIGLI